MSELIRRTGAEVERRPPERAVELAATAHRKVVVKRQELRVALSIAERTAEAPAGRNGGAPASADGDRSEGWGPARPVAQDPVNRLRPGNHRAATVPERLST
ncbi:hypothetical protein [Amycolatopsis sp. DSM 110486]|uniref:hypothetical protein n=1 Tax=Amycolatopsis sp. DSM 110486 TaxID=2865832 RepID=UPI001C69A81E|nr:hypothetical protein [Amycolatopsis sp. DSM 110486]QYN23947.1 hypothetical protein K1T34_16765 [Amycolatopsis sp. DSM 110486]